MCSTAHSYLVPDFMAAKIKALNPPKSLPQVATEAGFRRLQTLEAVLTGDVALPMDRVRQLASAINCSTAELTRLALKDWRLERLIEPILEATKSHDVTIAELEIISRLRMQLGTQELIIDEDVLSWIAAFPAAA